MADGASPEKFEQALKNVLAVLAEADEAREHICRMRIYCTDKAAYLAARGELGCIWRRLRGRRFPAIIIRGATSIILTRICLNMRTGLSFTTDRITSFCSR